MADATRFIMLGGFLGAGKTTAIGRLAQTYQQRGLRVGIVTNDQAADLVDTHTLRSQGFNVGEVAGACFCCNFDELMATAERFGSEARPDVILAEPVGSCTDLVATVVQPLVRLYATRFDVAPYGVILKPSHGQRILTNAEQAGFSPQAAYIFRKQLEEADFIVINRIDQLQPAEVDELAELVREHYPGVPVLRTSGVTGAGFDALVELLDQRGSFGERILELDYDVYAAGEAELGWLNCTVTVTAESPFSLDELLMDALHHMRASLAYVDAEIAHLKIIGLADGSHAVGNVVTSDSAAQLSLPSRTVTRRADLVVNARVAIDPDSLDEHVRTALNEACTTVDAVLQGAKSQSFRPGRPVPTHRFARPVE